MNAKVESTKKAQSQPQEEVNLGRKFLEDNPHLQVKRKIGEITGTPLFMIEGFEMAWCDSIDGAGDVARRITDWVLQRAASEKAKAEKASKNQKA